MTTTFLHLYLRLYSLISFSRLALSPSEYFVSFDNLSRLIWWFFTLFSVIVLLSSLFVLVQSCPVISQNRYSTKIPTPCRRLWCWCPRIFRRRHLPSKLAWKMFTLYWRCWCRFYEEKQFVVHFGTWTMNQNVLWQLKYLQTKTRKTKTDHTALTIQCNSIL